MIKQLAGLIRLYLPLLSHPDEEVRRYTALALYAAYGDQATVHVRLVLRAGTPEERRQARLALDALDACGGLCSATPPFGGIEIGCLGAFQVHINGLTIQVQDWGRYDSGRAGAQKLQSVFAYLAHTGARGATREAIIAAVWGNAAGAASLARALTSLRTLIADASGSELADSALVTDAERCMLRPDFIRNSADIFAQAFDLADRIEQRDGLAAAAPLYRCALELYGGPYMADIPRSNGWMLERRQLLLGHFVNAAERLAEQYVEEQRYRECVNVCTRAIDEAPDADDVTIWLLQAYLRLDQGAELERAYRRYLRATALNPLAPGATADRVIATYESLQRERKLGS